MDCNGQGESGNDFDRQREMMVDRQIKARGVKDQDVLDAMLKVKRHRFVPEEYIDQAYEDHPLPVGEGQTISQPYIVAVMTEMLELDRNSRILEIGTGSGYQAAVLAEICDSVYSIEIFESLANRAKNTLQSLNYNNVFIKTGDGYKGWPEHSPFDAIIVTCAPTHIPQPLKDQLAEGGRMIIPVGEYYSQDLILLEKKNGKLKEKNVLPVRFVPMIDDNGTKY
jgi:protein-L-isoaspartate(D-aspartate) O-methyltransferase